MKRNIVQLLERLFLCLLLTLGGALSIQAASTYPVQLSAQILPPYGNCLSDYVVEGMERLHLTALQRDMTKTDYGIIVRMQVKQGTKILIQSNAPYDLKKGIIMRLSASSLFNSGADVQVGGRFKENGFCLEEGAYEFVFQAFDGRNVNLPVSEPVYLQAFLGKMEPPICLSPANNGCVDYQSQALNFFWMESVVTMPRSDRSYELEIYEMPQDFDEFTQNPQNIVSSSSPIYTGSVMGNVNFIQVAQRAGLFVKGRTYAWRVRATHLIPNTTTDNTLAYVKNNGYSEISLFSFKRCVDQDEIWNGKKVVVDASLRPELLRVDTANATPKVVWRCETERYTCGYVVEYNTVDTLSAWSKIRVGVNDSTLVLPNVARGKEYIVRIQGVVCPSRGETDTVFSAYSNDTTFMLPKLEDADCGRPVPPLSSLKSLAKAVSPGGYITANGYDIKVQTCQMEQVGGDTLFSGTGLVSCPILKNKLSLKVKFDKVRINDQMELIQGMVVTVTDKDNSLDMNLNGLANKNYSGNGPAQLQGDSLPKYSKSDDIPANSLGVVDGKLYAKDAEGKAAEIASLVTTEPLSCEPQMNYLDDDQAVVTFAPQSDWNPPFDYEQGAFHRSLNISEYYEKMGVGYNIPWIAVTEGGQATIIANFKNVSNVIDPEKQVYFICRSGKQTLKMKAEYADGKFTVPIFGGEAGRCWEIFAMADTAKKSDCSKLFTIGRAKVLSMKREECTLHIVPIRRDAETIDKEAVEKQLNAIYHPLGKHFTIKVEQRFGDGEKFDFLDDGLQVEGTGFMTTETAEMKHLKALFNASVGFDQSENQAYLFVLPKSSNPEVLGDMPRCKPVGYLFCDPTTTFADGRTVAHELGHGLFTLDHSFAFGPEKGTTDNLMDYSNGATLKVWQWNLLDNHKGYVLPMFEADEDAF